MSSDPPAADGAAGTITLEGVTKSYDRFPGGVRIRHAVPGFKARPRQPFDALHGVDLTVAPGESLGIIGPNGAGKSTLLKLIAGVIRPTRGHISVAGRIGSMVELGLGFHPELTGWENIACTGVVLGLTRREVDRLAPAIAAFAGIEDALAAPLRTYSTGMRARLGFAVATHVGADILVIDEVLSVGDTSFQTRCTDRVATLRAGGTTIVFVSHELSLVAAVCDRAAYLEAGRIAWDGPTIETIDTYLRRSFRPSADAGVHLERCQLVSDQIRSWDPIRIDADVLVERNVDTVSIVIELERRDDTADRTIGRAIAHLPELGRAGRYRIRGTTTPFPGGAGSIDVVTSVVDQELDLPVDRCVRMLQIAGKVRPGNLALALIPSFTISPVAASEMRMPGSNVALASDDPVAARLVGVTKRFPPADRRRSARLLVPGRAGLLGDEVAALDGLDLEIGAGTSVGVIGPNGAGKSTMLRLLAGVTTPDEGTVETSGRVVPVLDLGLGFHPDLSGARNLEASAELLDIRPADLRDRYDAIVAFAGLVEVMDVPVKRYSTGMQARLGLALALHADADILLIDELLAGGDEEFRRRVQHAMRSQRDAGHTAVFVSHDLSLVEKVCDRVVRLDHGRLVDDGAPSEVVRSYGGRGWVAGSHNDSSGFRISELTIRRRQVPVGGSVGFEGVIEVTKASKHVRLDLSYRAPADHGRVVVPAVHIQEKTFLHATLEPADGVISRPGRYRFSGTVARNPVAGQFDLVLSVVDEREQLILDEAWQTVTVGNSGGRIHGLVLGMSWKVERLRDVPGQA